MTFEDQVFAKLDKIEEKLDLHAETHASISERLARVEVKLEGLAPPSKLRDGGFIVSGGAVAALLSFLAQHWKGSP